MKCVSLGDLVKASSSSFRNLVPAAGSAVSILFPIVFFVCFFIQQRDASAQSMQELMGLGGL